MNNTLLPNAPLFRDPIYDGAADPTIIWNRQENSWWIFYTNRRATAPGPGVAWVHGTDIGIASSSDGGRSWIYRGIAQGLEFENGRNTFWAPEVIYHDGIYHMYVSYIQGIPDSWAHSRDIIHYTSQNLWDWKFERILELDPKRKLIDACLYRLENGAFRMWYKNEADSSHIYAADSKDLYSWNQIGPVITDVPQEGPNVFFYKGKYWMITDMWKGLRVYHSKDCNNWEYQGVILETPGCREDDGAMGQHPDILVQGDSAYIFYFTHPEAESRKKEIKEGDWPYWRKRTSLQVAKLEIENGSLICDRNMPFDLSLGQGY